MYRYALEDSKDVRRRYRLQDWLNAMNDEDRDEVLSMLAWDTEIDEEAAEGPTPSTPA